LLLGYTYHRKQLCELVGITCCCRQSKSKRISGTKYFDYEPGTGGS